MNVTSFNSWIPAWNYWQEWVFLIVAAIIVCAIVAYARMGVRNENKSHNPG